MKILHCFADTGAEADTLQRFGNVIRVGINATENDSSQAIKADANHLPFKNITFDLGWFHPPCGFVSPMSDTGNNSRDDWDNLIPLARDIASEYCDDWVIENKPSEHINPTVVLSGQMFHLGIEYKRAFECSFPVETPIQSKLQPDHAETSPFYYSERSKGWWLAQKGCSDDYPTQHIAKNTIPAVYINHIMAAYEKYANNPESDYSDYDDRMQTNRRQRKNNDLLNYQQ